MLIEKPDNLNLKYYLNYPSEAQLIHSNGLSCLAPNGKDPSSYVYDVNTYRTDIGSLTLSGYNSSIVQFNGKGMGIYCDNKSSFSEDTVDLLKLFSENGSFYYTSNYTLGFGQEIVNTEYRKFDTNDKFMLFQNDRYNLIVPITEVPPQGEATYWTKDTLNTWFENFSDSQNTDEYNYYQVYKFMTDSVEVYSETKKYTPGQMCYYYEDPSDPTGDPDHLYICVVGTMGGAFYDECWDDNVSEPLVNAQY